jgi:RNA polymerase sigma factor (sigma-70 family)
MVGRNSGAALRQIHSLFTAGTFSGLSDQQLLERFLARLGEVSELAFTVLVERHGPMVLGVCRRILVDPHDAQDAFQATFLLLVRKAGSIRIDGSVGRWLFGVALRVASRARADARRRRGREHRGLDRLEVQVEDVATSAIHRAEIQAILAEELGRLPARLQPAVMLCDLEGLSHVEAAQRLGWPEGTVKSRLSRARALLRMRLLRRGLGPQDVASTLPLLPAALPTGLVETTARSASSILAGRIAIAATVSASVTNLTSGVLQTMFLTKLKLAAVAVVLVMAGSAVVFSQATAQKPEERTVAGGRLTPQAPAPTEAALDDELDVVMLERAWADAISRRDPAVVSRILVDDFEGIDPSGNIFTKASHLADLRSGLFTKQPIELDEVKARLFGETAVVTSRIKVRGSSTWGRMTSVYGKNRGRWQRVASHASWLAGATCPATSTPLGAGWTSVAGSRQERGQPIRPEGALNSCTACHTVSHQAESRPLPLADAIGARHADQVTRIRPRFDCQVETIHVTVGQNVKKGDPLLGLFSTDLAAAKNDLQTAYVQFNHDVRLLKMREELSRSNAISQQLLVDSQNEEMKSRLAYKISREKLKVLDVPGDQIDASIKEVASDQNVARERTAVGDKARLTLRSPVDGIILQVDATIGNLYDKNDALLVIGGASPDKPGVP